MENLYGRTLQNTKNSVLIQPVSCIIYSMHPVSYTVYTLYPIKYAPCILYSMHPVSFKVYTLYPIQYAPCILPPTDSPQYLKTAHNEFSDINDSTLFAPSPWVATVTPPPPLPNFSKIHYNRIEESDQ